MAEIIATELIKVVFQKLGEEALKRFVRSQGIQSDIKKLGTKLSKIQRLLNDAYEKENTNKDVKEWLNSLQHLAYDIDDVLDGLATDAKHQELSEAATTSKVRKFIPTCCTNISLSSKLHHKLDSINTRLHCLENEKKDLGLNVKDSSLRIEQTSLPDAPFSIVGRNNEMEKLLQKLLGDHGEPCKENFSIVPIVGLGGVGKTTLARLLYNETQVKDHFELMPWVCVSDDFDIFKISNTIFQAVTEENKEFKDLNQLQLELTEQLKEKLFLLVLDDVWSEDYDEWKNLVKPFQSCAPGSKIIITTRKVRLLEMLGFDHIDRLDSLSHEDAMSLLAQHALGVDNFDSNPTLKTQGEGIVRKCGGLPLALSAIGRSLRTKKDQEDWEDVLKSEIWDLIDVHNIVPALRLSYHDLPAHLKQLFAYCSFFPKDFVFDKEELVLLWMADGFLSQSTKSISPERLGSEYFEILLSKSFFQHAPNQDSRFVMHDLMNDLATFVAGDFFLRFDNQTEMENEALKKYRHMSFGREKFVSYLKFEALKKAKSLRTLIAVRVGVEQSWGHFFLSNKILVDLLPELPLLRVLNLSCFFISEIPESTGNLKHLRYLNFSHTQITELPECVGNLYNLETLIAFGCERLRKLPNSFLKLKCLRHFDIRDTPLLKKMPLGIGKLKSLQTLTKIIIEGGDGFAISELNELQNLQGKISIKGLEKVQVAKHARDANLSQRRLTELELEWGHVSDGSRNDTLQKEVLDAVNPRSDQLKKLRIVEYAGIEFPNWVGDPSFFQLTHVWMSHCKNCTYLPPLGMLPALKELYIKGMNNVKIVGSEFLGTGDAFRKLEVLSFEEMNGWVEWSTKSGSIDHVVFPCLQELHLDYCPKLVEVSLEALPSLKNLSIESCSDGGVLRSVVRAASSVTMLRISRILGLTDNVWRSVIEYLGDVEEIRIFSCNEIRYLWESEAKASKVLVKLRMLEVLYCDNLLGSGEKEEDDYGNSHLTSLKELSILDCKSIERCSCPNSIKKLKLHNCDSITSVSFPTAARGGWQKLMSLSIWGCEKLNLNEFGEVNLINNNTSSMPMLESVYFVGWPNLKSIIELSYSVHLTQLIISGCQGMESFPDLSNLTSLKQMEIRMCQSLDASFPRVLWPPNLSRLEIGELKKPMSEWGPQNFPTSLVELELYGGDDVSSWSQLSDLLPSSLIKLDIDSFVELESDLVGFQHLTSLKDLLISNCPKMTLVSTGFQHLTSLQHLEIRNCPNMTFLSTGLQHLTSLQHLQIHCCQNIEDLPEKLFPSLLSLTIYDCPKLKEKKDSYYWPLISHIPHIMWW